jgi:polyhydroxyalkanoate synthase
MRDHDLPFAVDEVRRRTGQTQLDLCCYSMGGMVVYGAIGRALDAEKIRRVIAFASPGQVRALGLLTLARFLPRWATPPVPMKLGMRTLAFAHPVLPHKTLDFFYNPKNVPARYARASMMDLFEDIPGPLGADFVRWSADRGRIVIDGEPLLSGLADVRVPVCFFAGTRDFLAPADFVRAAHDAWGANVPDVEKHFHLLGRDTGAREDYGHGDFAFGSHAEEEVFMPALAFLSVNADVVKGRDEAVSEGAWGHESGVHQGIRNQETAHGPAIETTHGVQKRA